MKRAPWLSAGIALAAAILGFLGGLALSDYRVGEAQQAVATAQLQRDYWKDRFEAEKGAAARKTVDRPEPQSKVRRKLLWPIAGSVLAVVVLAVLAVTFLPKRRKALSASKAAAVPARSPPELDVPADVPRLTDQPRKTEQAPRQAVKLAEGNPFRAMPPTVPNGVAARPTLTVERVVVTRTKHPSNAATQVGVMMEVKNVSASALPGCRIKVVEIHGGSDGLKFPHRFIQVAGGETFAMGAGHTKGIMLASRRYNVAPEERLKLNLAPAKNVFAMSDVDFDDNTRYDLEFRIESGAGTYTTANVKIEVGEYENLKVTLIDQSSWRQVPDSTGS